MNYRPFLSHLLLIIALTSCGNRKVVDPDQKSSTTKSFILEQVEGDSLIVGDKGKNKIIIEKYRSNDGQEVFVQIQFYQLNEYYENSKKNIKWYKTQKFYFEKDETLNIEAEFQDINNDGFADFSYRSALAARGGNEVRKLFVYNPEENDFVYIKNSEDYPNTYYNEELDCINSLILTGSTTTAFLKIKKDSLQEFARVDESDSIRVHKLGKDGKMHLIYKGAIGDSEDFYIPYINFEPLKKDSL